MKKAVLLAAILAGAILSQSFAANPPKKLTVQTVVFSERGVSALFSFLDETGCILRNVSVNSFVQSTIQSGSKTKEATTAIEIDEVDGCGSFPIMFAGGVTNTPGALVVAPDLKSARLKLTLEMNDSETFEGFPVTVDITFVAPGRLTNFSFHEVTQPDPKTTVLYAESDSSRGRATATGTIFGVGGTSIRPIDPTENLLPGPSDDGVVYDVLSTTVTITKP